MATPVQPTVENTHISASFGKLLEPGLRKIFFESYKAIPEQYSSIYNMLTSTKAQEHEWGMGALTDWEERTSELSEVSYAKVSPGLDRTYTHKAYTRGFMVGRELYDDDQYNQIEKMPKALARAGKAHVEKLAMTPLINGFSADIGGVGASAIYDAQPLFSATHPLVDSVKVGDNLNTGALSSANLQLAIMKMRSTLDEAGALIVRVPTRLIVPPALEYTARVILESVAIPGSANNDVNVVRGALELKVLDYLGTANGGSDTAWFLQDANDHELNFFWRSKVEFKWTEDFDTFVAKYRGYMRFSYGVSDYRGLSGSTGL
jgi:phage major head subunit gpT-like protein